MAPGRGVAPDSWGPSTFLCVPRLGQAGWRESGSCPVAGPGVGLDSPSAVMRVKPCQALCPDGLSRVEKTRARTSGPQEGVSKTDSRGLSARQPSAESEARAEGLSDGAGLCLVAQGKGPLVQGGRGF